MWDLAVISEQGQRWSMEDSYYLDSDFAGKGWCFGGVYDGHSGAFSSDYTARHLQNRFLEQIHSGCDPEEAFRRAYQLVSDDLANEDSGSTAVNFLVRGKSVTTANVGDSRAILIGKDSFRQLTQDHRLENPEESKRIREFGAEIVFPYIMRSGQGLMPSRTIGDPFFKPAGVIAEPYTCSTEVSKDEFALIAGCDGLFDFMSNQEVAEFARESGQAQELVDLLEKEVLLVRGGMDNLTIICLIFSP